LISRLTPARQALALLLLHVLLWTALPLLVSRNLPLDTVEALAWGREWQWGYHKHPPLSGWFAEMARVGAHDWPLYLLSQLMVGGAMVASWLLARDLLGRDAASERLALVAVMALEGVHYYNLSSVEFNANVVMFPFWAGASLCLWRAMQPVLRAPPGLPAGAPKPESGLGWWLGLGLCCGLGLMGKYVFALLPLAILAYTVIQPRARAAWRTPGPWLALALALLINLPHLMWAARLDWPTIRYAVGRGHTEGLTLEGSWLREFMSFVVAQALALSPLFGLLALLGRGQVVPRPAAERWLIFTLGAGPLLLLMLAATLAQARMVHMWATPFFVCSATLWLGWRRPVQPRLGRFTLGWAMWMALMVASYAAIYLLGPQVKHRLDRLSFPGREVAAELSARWRAETGHPLAIVGGEEFVAGSLGHYAPDRPSVFYDADLSESLWLDEARVHREGALFVWPISRGEHLPADLPPDSRTQVAPLLARFPHTQARPTFVMQTSWMGRPYVVAMAWAVLPPEDKASLAPSASASAPGAPGKSP
jgi:hypothetical protein